jgi:hypothetical protein
MQNPIRFIVLILTFSLMSACGALLKPRSLTGEAPLRGGLDTESQGDEVGGVLNDSEDGEDSDNPEAEENSGETEAASGTENAAEEGASPDEQSDTASNDSDSPSGSDAGASCQEIYSGVSDCYYEYDVCASNCQNNQCYDECEDAYGICFENELSLGSEQGQAEFNSLRTCEQNLYPECYEDAIETWEACTDSCQDQQCVDECSEEANINYGDCMIGGCGDEYTTCGLI